MWPMREGLDFELRLDAESIFIYYLTGTLGLVFVITVGITRSLQRTQPIVTELIHDSNITEDLVTYLITVQTSIWPGSGCPNGVKVYLQLVGMNSTSQYFLLQSKGSSKAILQRGFTDIFLVKLPVSLGPVSSVKFILSGLRGPLTWKIRRVDLHRPSTDVVLQIPASIVITERCDPNTHHKVRIVKDGLSLMEKLFIYHQWFGAFANTVRYGAFTPVTHVLCVFTTLAVLLDLTLATYILLPEEGGLWSLSLLFGTICPAYAYCLILFFIELMLRNVRSMSEGPGNAYYTVCDENKNMNATCRKTGRSSSYPCIMNENVFETALVWDPNFKTITRFLTKFCAHVNSKSAFLRFQKGAQHESAYDITQDTVPNLHVPRYSGIALNHLLGDRNSQGDMKKSSLFNLIQENQSSASLQSSDNNRGKSSGESINIINEPERFNQIKNGNKLVEKKSSRFVNDCSINSNLFWRQYKMRKQSSKHKRTFDDISTSVLDSDQEFMDEVDQRRPEDKDDIRLKSDVPSIQCLTDTHQGNVRNRKRSNLAKKNEVDEKRKVYANRSDFVIDIVGDAAEDEVKLDQHDDEVVEIDLFDCVEDKLDMLSSEVTKLHRQANEEVRLDLLDDEVKLDLLDEEEEEFEEADVDVYEEATSGTKSTSEDDLEEYYSAKSSEDSITSAEPSYTPADMDSVNWESIHKSRSRKLVTDICKFYRQVRIQVIEGEVINVLPVIIDWFDDVISSIVMACFSKRQTCMEDLTKKTEIINLTMYLSGEIILFTMNQVYASLKSGNIDLPDIVVQSHHMMLGVEEAAYSILYALNNDFLDSKQLKIVRNLEMQRYVCQICTEFLKHSFQLIVHANELTWAYFEIYLLQTIKDTIDLGTFHTLMDFISDNLQHESEEKVILQKLCKTAMEEAKGEVWEEYHDEKNMFIDMTVKQDILNKLMTTRHEVLQRKTKFDDEYKLRSKPRKSRLQILAEKRKKVDPEEIQERKDRENSVEKWLLWERETGCMTAPSYRELIQHSMYLETGASHLKWIKEQVEKRWTRLGLKSQTDGMSCLVHSLIYTHIEGEGVTEMDKFKDYLQVKRVENYIGEFIQTMLDDLSEYLVVSTAEEYNLMEFPAKSQLKLSVEDICIRVDIMKDLLHQELETITDYALGIERKKLTMDQNLIENTTRLIIKKSSHLLHCSPSLTDDFMLTKRPGKVTSMCDQTTRENEMNDRTVHFDETAGLTVKQNLKVSELNLAVDFSELKTEFRLIQHFLKDFTHAEKMRNECTLLGYLERQKRKCSRIANIALHNIIDSYYIIEEGDDTKTFTKAGLYQVEHDVMGEGKKRLPHYMKTLLTGFLLLIIVLSFIWVTLVGSQFDTKQNQEFVLYYLISVFQFALLFEPFRALAIGSVCSRR